MKNWFILFLLVFNIVFIGITLRNRYSAHSLPEIQFNNWAPYKMNLLCGENLVDQTSQFFLLIFFNADVECGCLEEWPYWSKLAGNSSLNLSVIGIFNGHDITKFLRFYDASKLPFPVFIDEKRNLQKYCHVVPEEVSKALVNDKGQILFLDTNQTKNISHRQSYNRIMHIIALYEGTLHSH